LYIHSVGNTYISFIHFEGIHFSTNSFIFHLVRGIGIFHIKNAHLKLNNFPLRYALYDVNFETICYRSFPFDEITSLYQ